MTRTRAVASRHGVAAAAVLVAVVLAGCSSGGGTPASTPPSSTDSVGTPHPAATSGPPQALTAGLLSAAELRNYRVTRVTDTTSQALPCTPHAPGLAAQFPPQTRAYVALASKTLRSSLQETLLGYPDAASVDDVFAAARDGYNCTAGTVNGIRAGIAHVSNTATGADRTERWDYRLATGVLGTTVIVQAGRVYAQLDFVAGIGGSGELDPDVVVQAALHDIQARLGG